MGTSLSSKSRKLGVGLAFIAPNIVGFLAFTLFPLVFSLFLAFTNWDLRYHNQFQSESLRFVGLDNMARLFQDQRFWRYLGNTLFFMMGIPVAMAGSLLAAILLNRKLPCLGRWFGLSLAGSILCAAAVILTLTGIGGSMLSVLILGLGGLIFFGGFQAGGTLYRVLFYTPHFTAGVATYVLWKKLYSPTNGPINTLLETPLHTLSAVIRALPAGIGSAGLAAAAVLTAVILFLGWRFFSKRWIDSDLGTGTLCIGFLLLVLPVWVACDLFPISWMALIPTGVLASCLLVSATHVAGNRRFEPCAVWKGCGMASLVGVVFLVLGMIAVGFGLMLFSLPSRAQTGLVPPEWLSDYSWAKPALMIMALWAAIGSNNMILYLAGLSNVPVELEEAAKIDGATAWQKFWNVTWPQLAPITFFIFIMSVIHGLQGGFEMARVMTNGGPAGATTTLSYFIYTEGFETGRLGYASAIAWVLFGIVLLVTLINWRFGSRYTND